MEKQDFKFKNLPNQLTIARVCAIPLFIVLLMMGFRVAATIVFLLAAFTDMLDGKIARRYNLVTNFGKLMDPLADKLLTMSAFVCLVELGDIPGWMVIVILGREFIITGMRQVAAAEGIVIARDQARHTDVHTTNKYLKGNEPVHDETKHFDGEL